MGSNRIGKGSGDGEKMFSPNLTRLCDMDAPKGTETAAKGEGTSLFDAISVLHFLQSSGKGVH